MPPKQNPPLSSPDQDPLFVPSGSETTSEPKKVEIKTHQLDISAAMANFEISIKKFGDSNEAAGLLFVAEQPEESLTRQDLVESVGGEAELDVRYGSLKGNEKSADVTRREGAEGAYITAIRYMTGVNVPKNDLTLQVGLTRFSQLYGDVGEKAQAARRRAKTKLQQSRKNNSPKIPIGVFYDPNVKLYASSLVKEGRLPWSEVASSIGLSTAEADPADLPLLAHVFEFVDAAHEPILTREEMKQQRLLTEESLRGAYYGARNAKKKKVLEEEIAGKQLSEFELRKVQRYAEQLAEEKGREVEKATYEGRSRRAKRHTEQLQGQLLLLDKLRWTIRQEQGMDFELTSEDIKIIREQIIPDYAEAMVEHTGLNRDQESLLADDVVRGVFSPDKNLADRITDRLMWSIQQRQSAIERQAAIFAKVPRHIGKSSIAATVKHP